jgi:hypothetical protein
MYSHPMHLDRKLFEDIQVHHQDCVVFPDMFGFEIELEGKKLKTQKRDIVALWDIHNDGSLRIKQPGEEAIEYVLRRPLKLEDTYTAIKILFDHLNGEGVEVFPSYRTSIHVHVNCAADTLRHIYNFITLAIIFDELFVSQNGEHRIGNNFCLRAKDAQGQIAEMINSIMHHGNLYGLNANHRYSSVNFVSLMKYGTLEFRSLECTTDFKRVEHWVETLATLKAASRQFDDPQDIIRYFSRMSEKEFLYFVLGHCASKYAKVAGFEGMLREGMRLAQDLAFASKWATRDKKKDDAEYYERKKKAYQKVVGMAPVAMDIEAQAPVGNAPGNGLLNFIQAGGQHWALNWADLPVEVEQ